jgi:hypothetical protein
VWKELKNNRNVEYWVRKLERINSEIKFEGDWIDMNEK